MFVYFVLFLYFRLDVYLYNVNVPVTVPNSWVRMIEFIFRNRILYDLMINDRKIDRRTY
jgi:hypothetical protein